MFRMVVPLLAVVLWLYEKDGGAWNFPAGLKDLQACHEAAKMIIPRAKKPVVGYNCQDLGEE